MLSPSKCTWGIYEDRCCWSEVKKWLLDAAPNIVEVVTSFSLSLEAQMTLWACNLCDSQPKGLQPGSVYSTAWARQAQLNSSFAMCWAETSSVNVEWRKKPREEKLLHTLQCCPLCGAAKLPIPASPQALEHARATSSQQSTDLPALSCCWVPNQFPPILCSLTAAIWQKMENKSCNV